MIYVTIDIRYEPNGYERRHGVAHVEQKIKLGPFIKLIKGYEAEIIGIKKDGESELTYQGSIGAGGYCVTCEYDYPDLSFSNYKKMEELGIPVRSYNVTNVEITTGD
jgi:hypothetical protein